MSIDYEASVRDSLKWILSRWDTVDNWKGLYRELQYGNGEAYAIGAYLPPTLVMYAAVYYSENKPANTLDLLSGILASDRIEVYRKVNSRLLENNLGYQPYEELSEFLASDGAWSLLRKSIHRVSRETTVVEATSAALKSADIAHYLLVQQLLGDTPLGSRHLRIILLHAPQNLGFYLQRLDIQRAFQTYYREFYHPGWIMLIAAMSVRILKRYRQIVEKVVTSLDDAHYSALPEHLFENYSEYCWELDWLVQILLSDPRANYPFKASLAKAFINSGLSGFDLFYFTLDWAVTDYLQLPYTNDLIRQLFHFRAPYPISPELKSWFREMYPRLMPKVWPEVTYTPEQTQELMDYVITHHK
jgi:hypothetical protein